MKTVNSYNIQIWVGLKEGYDGEQHSIKEVEEELQQFTDALGECITITPTKYIYKNGNEEGVVIGLINYPRFERKSEELTGRAFEIASMLMRKFKQYRVTITTPDVTYMMESDELYF